MSGLKSFASDTRGNVAMMFGLLVVAVFGISGLAIDYSRCQRRRKIRPFGGAKVGNFSSFDH